MWKKNLGRAFVGLYLEETLGQRKKHLLCISQGYRNVNHGHLIFELLRNLNIKLAAGQHSCHCQDIMKFLLKISHLLSEGTILISAQNSTSNLYTLSVLEVNKNMPIETSLNMGFSRVSLSFILFCLTGNFILWPPGLRFSTYFFLYRYLNA